MVDTTRHETVWALRLTRNRLLQAPRNFPLSAPTGNPTSTALAPRNPRNG